MSTIAVSSNKRSLVIIVGILAITWKLPDITGKLRTILGTKPSLLARYDYVIGNLIYLHNIIQEMR